MKILTANGFKDFKSVKKSNKIIGVTIILENGENLSCTAHTKIKANGKWKLARNFEVGDTINNQKIVEIKPMVSEFYDIIEVEDEASFIVNKNFLVHNCAFIKNYAEFENAITPTISSSNQSKVIMTSTPIGLNHWYDMWINAEEGKSIYKNYKVEWHAVPGRDAKWKEEKIKTLKGGARAFAQEYACEFLGSSDTLVDINTLIEMKSKKAIKVFNDFKIYKEPEPNNNYIMLIDPARGGGDNFAVHVINVTKMPFVQVASAVFNEYYLKIPPKLLDILNYYNKALLIMENNDASGLSVVDLLFNVYEYENIYKEKINGIRGVRTTKLTRDRNLNLMKWVLENKKLILHDKDTIDELMVFVNIDGKYQAQSGKTDDLVMSLSLLFFIFNNIKYLDNYQSFLASIDSMEAEKEEERNEFLDLITTCYFHG